MIMNKHVAWREPFPREETTAVFNLYNRRYFEGFLDVRLNWDRIMMR